MNPKPMIVTTQVRAKPRVLVAIANHGTKNKRFLDCLLTAYRGMRKYHVDIVLLSDLPKDLDPDVEVVVGAPTEDPWSLPFGYKTIFEERVDQYDLFIYSEDDTLIEEKNVDAFLAATQVLPQECIAGFMRYEISPAGTKHCSTIHGYFHWDSQSVIKAGGEVFAHYTNEHSACFIITRDQLKRGLANGGFLYGPRKGRYDMLCTAATDPYTQCGLKKLICISRFEDFCLHHLPNVYLGRIGLPFDEVARELEVLMGLTPGDEWNGPLVSTNTTLHEGPWQKQHYEENSCWFSDLIPPSTSNLLSVGCANGGMERALLGRGIRVTGIPLDAISATTARTHGVETVPPSFPQALRCLLPSSYDCIVVSNIAQHLENPATLFSDLRPLLTESGIIIVSAPNFETLRTLVDRFGKRRGFKPVLPQNERREFGLHLTSRRRVEHWLRAGGWYPVNTRFLLPDSSSSRLARAVSKFRPAWVSRHLVVAARPQNAHQGNSERT